MNSPELLAIGCAILLAITVIASMCLFYYYSCAKDDTVIENTDEGLVRAFGRPAISKPSAEDLGIGKELEALSEEFVNLFEKCYDDISDYMVKIVVRQCGSALQDHLQTYKRLHQPPPDFFVHMAVQQDSVGRMVEEQQAAFVQSCELYIYFTFCEKYAHRSRDKLHSGLKKEVRRRLEDLGLADSGLQDVIVFIAKRILYGIAIRIEDRFIEAYESELVALLKRNAVENSEALGKELVRRYATAYSNHLLIRTSDRFANIFEGKYVAVDI